MRVTAAPVDGAANRVLIRLVADALGVPPSTVSLVSGASGRLKRLRVGGVARIDLLERWPGLTLSR